MSETNVTAATAACDLCGRDLCCTRSLIILWPTADELDSGQPQRRAQICSRHIVSAAVYNNLPKRQRRLVHKQLWDSIDAVHGRRPPDKIPAVRTPLVGRRSKASRLAAVWRWLVTVLTAPLVEAAPDDADCPFT